MIYVSDFIQFYLCRTQCIIIKQKKFNRKVDNKNPKLVTEDHSLGTQQTRTQANKRHVGNRTNYHKLSGHWEPRRGGAYIYDQLQGHITHRLLFILADEIAPNLSFEHRMQRDGTNFLWQAVRHFRARKSYAALGLCKSVIRCLLLNNAQVKGTMGSICK